MAHFYHVASLGYFETSSACLNTLKKHTQKKVNVKNGKITDKFKALERHVYVIDIAK